MPTVFFDGDKRRIYEVPDAPSSFVVDGSGYRVYTPDDNRDDEFVQADFQQDIWSDFQDWHKANEWSTIAFGRTGGAPRGGGQFATNDYSINTSLGWKIVPANYPHIWEIYGNLLSDEGNDIPLFDNSRNTESVCLNLRMADSLLTIETGSGLSTEQDTKLTQLHGQSRRTLWINPALPDDGNGYQQSPYKLVNSFIDDAEANGITLGYTLGDIELLKSMRNIILEGIGSPNFDPKGFDLKGMLLRYIKFDGVSSGANRYILEDCELMEGAGIYGKAKDCTLHGNISLTGNTHIIDGKSNIEGAGYYSVDTNGFLLQVTNWFRSLGIKNMTSGIHTVHMNGGQLHCDVGCSGGIIYLRGNYSKKPNNLGAVVIIDETEKANLLGTESFP